MQKPITLMQVLRVPPMGKLVVSVKQDRYESLDEIENPTVKQALLAAIGELVTFAGGYEALVDKGLAPAIQPAQPASRRIEETLTAEQAQFIAALEAERDALKAAAQEADPVLPEIPEDMATMADKISDPVKQKPVEPPPAPVSTAATSQTKSLVTQIDAILQKYIETDSALSGRVIHLIQAPSGGIKIDVDGRLYDKPQDIEEPVVQAAIKRALKEWEST